MLLTQTYPNLELVVVEDGTDDTLAQHIRDLGDPRIRHHRLPPEGRTLGELRNEAVDRATGPYVCQWDDDDLYDPERVETQMAAILALGAEACFLARERLRWPARRKLAVSCARVWEGSMVCAKDRLPRYPAQRRGEDTPVAEGVVRTCRVVSIDAPELYTYVCHGNNTFNESHFAEHFAVATEIWAEPGVYAERLLAMVTRLPIEPGEIAHAETGPAARTSERPQAVVEPAVAPASERPLVLVLTPLKDAAAFLPGYLDSLRSLDYPREAISLGLLEGDSKDTTPDLLQQVLPGLEAEYRRVTLVRRDFGLQLARPRWEPGIQRRRLPPSDRPVETVVRSRPRLVHEWDRSESRERGSGPPQGRTGTSSLSTALWKSVDGRRSSRGVPLGDHRSSVFGGEPADRPRRELEQPSVRGGQPEATRREHPQEVGVGHEHHVTAVQCRPDAVQHAIGTLSHLDR